MWAKCLVVLQCRVVSSISMKDALPFAGEGRETNAIVFPTELLIFTFFFSRFCFYFSETSSSSPKTMMKTDLLIAGDRSNLPKTECD